MKSSLNWWNYNDFCNITQRVRDTEDKVIDQDLELVVNWSVKENIVLKKLQALYHQAHIQEEVFQKEKSRDKQIKEGDRNTTYFHAKINARIWENITRLQLG